MSCAGAFPDRKPRPDRQAEPRRTQRFRHDTCLVAWTDATSGLVGIEQPIGADVFAKDDNILLARHLDPTIVERVRGGIGCRNRAVLVSLAPCRAMRITRKLLHVLKDRAGFGSFFPGQDLRQAANRSSWERELSVRRRWSRWRRSARSGGAAGNDAHDPEANQDTAAKLAVGREIEQREVAHVVEASWTSRHGLPCAIRCVRWRDGRSREKLQGKRHPKRQPEGIGARRFQTPHRGTGSRSRSSDSVARAGTK